MDVRVYSTEMRKFVNDEFADFGPVSETAAPAGSIAERIAAWRDRPARPTEPLVFYHADGGATSSSSADRRVRFLGLPEYYALQVGNFLTPLSLFLGLAGETAADEPTILAAEEAILGRFNGHYGELLLPPTLLEILSRAAEGEGATAFVEALERARGKLMDPTLGASELPMIRIAARLRALELGADGALVPGQVQALELATDVFFIQASARLDLRWAEAQREVVSGTKPTRSALLNERDQRQDFTWEKNLPWVVRRPQFSGLNELEKTRLEAYLGLLGELTSDAVALTDTKWAPVLDLHPPVPGPAFPAPTLVSELKWPTEPSGPTAVQAPRPQAKTFEEIRADLAAEIVGRDDLVDELALTVLLHLRGNSSRVLLTGPSGSGKTFAAKAMAQAAGVPYAVISATDIVETGYRGMNVSDLLAPLYEACGRSVSVMETALLVIDEVDKLRMPVAIRDTVGYEKKKGQQDSLLGLIGGGTPVRFSSNGRDDGDTELDTASMLVVLTGAFSDCDFTGVRPASPSDLEQAGFLRELAERMGTSIHLPPRTASELAKLFRQRSDGIAAMEKAYTDLGLRLEVSDAALGFVARAVELGRGGLGPRSGMALLARVAKQRLVQLLKEKAPEGTAAVISPDDIDLPPDPDGGAVNSVDEYWVH